MSTYESDPNKWTGDLNGDPDGVSTDKGDPVGKRYGAKDLGSVGGRFQGEGGSHEAVIEIRKTEVAALPDVIIRIPAYSTVTEVLVETNEAFGALDTFLLNLDGNSLTAAAIDVDDLGLDSVALTATVANLSTGATGANLTVDGALLDAAGVVGICKVVVRYNKV